MANLNYHNVSTRMTEMVSILQFLPEGATIAGGYLRDLLTNRTPSDMDIFVPEEPTADQLAALNEHLGLTGSMGAFSETYRRGDPLDPTGYEGSEDNSRDKMTVLYEATKGDFNFDIIVVPDVSKYISEFPDNISRVWFDLAGLLSEAADFTSGHLAEHIEYRCTAEQPRLDKLRAYYPAYSLSYVL